MDVLDIFSELDDVAEETGKETAEETAEEPEEIDEETELRLLVQGIKDLPTVPSVLMKLVTLSLDNVANADAMSKIINLDMTISAKLLRISNSAFYGFRGKVTNISRAIMILGFNEVKSQALGMSMFQAFSKATGNVGLISATKLWTHSIATAAVSKYLTKKIGAESSETVATACLLHDIGKVVLLHSFREDYKKVAAIIEKTKCSIAEAELQVFKVTHNTIGEWLCKRWKMPDEIVQCVKYHAEPDKAKDEHFHIVSMVHIANIVTQRSFVGFGGDELKHEVSQTALARLGFSEEGLQQAIDYLEKEKDSILSVS